jgi:uncharacterized protein (TIGR00299 family) protein
MKLYLECNMGAAGDMLMAALLELLPDRELFLRRMNNLGLPGTRIECVPASKCGISGTRVRVYVHGEEEKSTDVNLSEQAAAHDHHNDHHDGHDHGHDHPHNHAHSHTHIHDEGHEHGSSHGTAYSFNDICSLIEGLDLAENVKEEALAVYKLLGEAEAAVHHVPMSDIHFHEVGTLDAVADIIGCCLLIHMLNVKSISASPVHVGSGFVRCSHGVLPVPAPATAYLLQGVPMYGGQIKGELCTPTGAAILKHFVKRFGSTEPITAVKIGYGMGSKDFEAANCVRAYLYDDDTETNEVTEIICNLDDMTSEAIGYASELLMESGALDVFSTPVTMKKSRPAVMLTCLCKPEDKDRFSLLMLKHTTTLGVRYRSYRRTVMPYHISTIETAYGPIRIKSALGYGISKSKPEYEDIRKAAQEHNVPFAQVYEEAMLIFKQNVE